MVSRVTGTGRPAKSPYQAEPPGPCPARGAAIQASGRAPRGLGVGTLGLGGLPATYSAEPPGYAHGPASQATGQHCRGPSPVSIAAYCEAEPWTGAPDGQLESCCWTSQPSRPATRDFHPPDGRPAARTKSRMAGATRQRGWVTSSRMQPVRNGRTLPRSCASPGGALGVASFD